VTKLSAHGRLSGQVPMGTISREDSSNHDQTHRVMFDSDREAAFLVHTPERVIKFIMSPEGLFYHAPNYCTATQLRQTVWEDESFYSHLQKE